MSDRHSRRSATSTVVVEEESQDEIAIGPCEGQADQEGHLLDPGRDDLYPIALLKIVMAMKELEPSDTLHFEDLLDKVLDDMVVDRDDFARYVQRNMSRLVTDARKGEY